MKRAIVLLLLSGLANAQYMDPDIPADSGYPVAACSARYDQGNNALTMYTDTSYQNVALDFEGDGFYEYAAVAILKAGCDALEEKPCR